MEATNNREPIIRKRLISVTDYHRMGAAGILTEDDRIELINGEIVEMSPISSEHAAIVNKINKYFSKVNLPVVISIQNPVYIDDASEPEPDIALLKPAAHFYSKQHPGKEDVYLIIQVAGSSLAFDRTVKAPLYAKAGFNDYWIINLTDRCIEAYHSIKQGQYAVREIYHPGDQIQLPILNKAADVSEFFIQVN